MILDKMGIFSKAQDITGGSPAASTNQVKMTAKQWAAITDAWFAVETETAAASGDASDTFAIELRVATSTALTTYKQVMSVDIIDQSDYRLALAGRRVCAVNVGELMQDACKALRDAESLTDSDYIYAGVYYTVSASAAVSFNAALSPSRPPTDHHAQVVDSPVGVPAHCSAGS